MSAPDIVITQHTVTVSIAATQPQVVVLSGVPLAPGSIPVNHSDLQNPNGVPDVQHLTAAEKARALNPNIPTIPVNHNDLQQLNGNPLYQHLTTDQIANLALKFDPRDVITGAYVLSPADHDKILPCSGTFSVTFPNNDTVPIANGFTCVIYNIGTGVISKVANTLTTSSLTIEAKESAVVWKKADHEWYSP